MFVILDGTGTLRLGGTDYPLKAGDVAVCPAGGPETAHQIVNTGAAELRYLAISTMIEPDICEYPDSGKFAVLSDTAPAGEKAKGPLWYVGRREARLNYWDGEGE